MRVLATILFSFILQITQAQMDSYQPSYKYQTNKITISDEIEIAYVDEGQQNEKVLLMVHGLGGYIKNWYPTIDGLKESYRCIALDLPGYGQSTIRDFQQEDYMEFFANSIIQFVEKMKLEEVVLLGHSMGGQVSIVVAIKNPEWLSQLILAAPAGFETFSDQHAALLKQFSSAKAIIGHDEQQIRDAYRINFVSMPEAAEELIQDRLKAKEADWFPEYALVREMGVRGMLDHPVLADIEKIKFPTMVIFGDSDNLIPNKYLHPDLTTEKIAEIGRRISNIEIKILQDAGHMLQMDNPADFNSTIKQLLTN